MEATEGTPPNQLRSAQVAAARQTLADARAQLDVAVEALPDIDGDEAMATPRLMTLLLGAVRAKEHLAILESSSIGQA